MGRGGLVIYNLSIIGYSYMWIYPSCKSISPICILYLCVPSGLKLRAGRRQNSKEGM